MINWKSYSLGGMRPHLGMLLLRVGVGVIFIAHGWMKLNNLEQTNGFFVSLGFPSFMGGVIGVIEVVAGLAVLVGTYVGLAGLLLAAIMIVAIVLVTGRNGLVGGYELELLLLLSSLAVAKLGPGMYSLDAKRGMVAGGMMGGCCGGGACGAGGCGSMQEGCCDESGMCSAEGEGDHMVVVEDGEVVAVVEEPKA